jgi:hypothetical protein
MRGSAPGPEYPVYITNKPPLPPDGLSVALRQSGAALTWGEVLGPTEYRLYAGDRLVWSFIDGQVSAEYAVSAVNGIGEGPRSLPVRTARDSWLTLDPKPEEPFRRDTVSPVFYPK